MKDNKFLIVLLVVAVFGLILSLKNYFDMRSLYCDLSKSVIAEREYTYPILRKIEDPMNYGPGGNDPRTKDLENPITTNSKYIDHCN